jgi:hypothetical protein
MKILIWTGHHDLLDSAIKFMTHGKGGHAAFLRSDNKTVHEAFYPRVRDRLLTQEDRLNAEVYELEGVLLTQHKAFETLFDKHLREGIKYSILDLFRYALNIPNRDEKHTFCSRYVMHCCQEVLGESRWPLVRLPSKDWASPRDLRISPKLISTSFKTLH